MPPKKKNKLKNNLKNSHEKLNTLSKETSKDSKDKRQSSKEKLNSMKQEPKIKVKDNSKNDVQEKKLSTDQKDICETSELADKAKYVCGTSKNQKRKKNRKKNVAVSVDSFSTETQVKLRDGPKYNSEMESSTNQSEKKISENNSNLGLKKKKKKKSEDITEKIAASSSELIKIGQDNISQKLQFEKKIKNDVKDVTDNRDSSSINLDKSLKKDLENDFESCVSRQSRHKSQENLKNDFSWKTEKKVENKNKMKSETTDFSSQHLEKMVFNNSSKIKKDKKLQETSKNSFESSNAESCGKEKKIPTIKLRKQVFSKRDGERMLYNKLNNVYHRVDSFTWEVDKKPQENSRNGMDMYDHDLKVPVFSDEDRVLIMQSLHPENKEQQNINSSETPNFERSDIEKILKGLEKFKQEMPVSTSQNLGNTGRKKDSFNREKEKKMKDIDKIKVNAPGFSKEQREKIFYDSLNNVYQTDNSFTCKMKNPETTSERSDIDLISEIKKIFSNDKNICGKLNSLTVSIEKELENSLNSFVMTNSDICEIEKIIKGIQKIQLETPMACSSRGAIGKKLKDDTNVTSETSDFRVTSEKKKISGNNFKKICERLDSSSHGTEGKLPVNSKNNVENSECCGIDKILKNIQKIKLETPILSSQDADEKMRTIDYFNNDRKLKLQENFEMLSSSCVVEKKLKNDFNCSSETPDFTASFEAKQIPDGNLKNICGKLDSLSFKFDKKLPNSESCETEKKLKNNQKIQKILKTAFCSSQLAEKKIMQKINQLNMDEDIKLQENSKKSLEILKSESYGLEKKINDDPKIKCVSSDFYSEPKKMSGENSGNTSRKIDSISLGIENKLSDVSENSCEIPNFERYDTSKEVKDIEKNQKILKTPVSSIKDEEKKIMPKIDQLNLNQEITLQKNSKHSFEISNSENCEIRKQLIDDSKIKFEASNFGRETKKMLGEDLGNIFEKLDSVSLGVEKKLPDNSKSNCEMPHFEGSRIERTLEDIQKTIKMSIWSNSGTDKKMIQNIDELNLNKELKLQENSETLNSGSCGIGNRSRDDPKMNCKASDFDVGSETKKIYDEGIINICELPANSIIDFEMAKSFKTDNKSDPHKIKLLPPVFSSSDAKQILRTMDFLKTETGRKLLNNIEMLNSAATCESEKKLKNDCNDNKLKYETSSFGLSPETEKIFGENLGNILEIVNCYNREAETKLPANSKNDFEIPNPKGCLIDEKVKDIQEIKLKPILFSPNIGKLMNDDPTNVCQRVSPNIGNSKYCSTDEKVKDIQEIKLKPILFSPNIGKLMNDDPTNVCQRVSPDIGNSKCCSTDEKVEDIQEIKLKPILFSSNIGKLMNDDPTNVCQRVSPNIGNSKCCSTDEKVKDIQEIKLKPILFSPNIGKLMSDDPTNVCQRVSPNIGNSKCCSTDEKVEDIQEIKLKPILLSPYIGNSKCCSTDEKVKDVQEINLKPILFSPNIGKLMNDDPTNVCQRVIPFNWENRKKLQANSESCLATSNSESCEVIENKIKCTTPEFNIDSTTKTLLGENRGNICGRLDFVNLEKKFLENSKNIGEKLNLENMGTEKKIQDDFISDNTDSEAAKILQGEAKGTYENLNILSQEAEKRLRDCIMLLTMLNPDEASGLIDNNGLLRTDIPHDPLVEIDLTKVMKKKGEKSQNKKRNRKDRPRTCFCCDNFN